jgi:hypothetical protein
MKHSMSSAILGARAKAFYVFGNDLIAVKADPVAPVGA